MAWHFQAECFLAGCFHLIVKIRSVPIAVTFFEHLTFFDFLALLFKVALRFNVCTSRKHLLQPRLKSCRCQSRLLDQNLISSCCNAGTERRMLTATNDVHDATWDEKRNVLFCFLSLCGQGFLCLILLNNISREHSLNFTDKECSLLFSSLCVRGLLFSILLNNISREHSLFYLDGVFPSVSLRFVFEVFYVQNTTKKQQTKHHEKQRNTTKHISPLPPFPFYYFISFF